MEMRFDVSDRQWTGGGRSRKGNEKAGGQDKTVTHRDKHPGRQHADVRGQHAGENTRTRGIDSARTANMMEDTRAREATNEATDADMLSAQHMTASGGQCCAVGAGGWRQARTHAPR